MSLFYQHLTHNDNYRYNYTTKYDAECVVNPMYAAKCYDIVYIYSECMCLYCTDVTGSNILPRHIVLPVSKELNHIWNRLVFVCL